MTYETEQLLETFLEWLEQEGYINNRDYDFIDIIDRFDQST